MKLYYTNKRLLQSEHKNIENFIYIYILYTVIIKSFVFLVASEHDNTESLKKVYFHINT